MTVARRPVVLRRIARRMISAGWRTIRRIAGEMSSTRRRRLRRLAHRLAPPSLRWVDSALDKLRRELPADGLRVRLSDPPGASASLTGAAELWLRARRATCLERALVMQRWLFALGQPRSVLIGIAPQSDGLSPGSGRVMAHAWLDDEDPQGHEVVTQLAPAVQGSHA